MGQEKELQERDSELLPAQPVPTHERVREDTPPPHETEQVLHDPQGPHSPVELGESGSGRSS